MKREKCPYCDVRLQIVPLHQYLHQVYEEGWVFWCRQCQRYFAAPTDHQVRQFLCESPHYVSTFLC